MIPPDAPDAMKKGGIALPGLKNPEIRCIVMVKKRGDYNNCPD
jgi:hypothetical protein